jgi:tetratricopeptide (TPR) repeat protein
MVEQRRARGAWLVVAACGLALGGCAGGGQHADSRQAAEPVFKGMGTHHREVTTVSPEAQRYFDQGLNWAFSFNHDEAIKSFDAATKADPLCAAAWWGIALCNGPHINNPAMDEEHSKAAWDAVQKARSLAGSPQQKALIEALASRYADPAAGKVPQSPEERAPLDRAYASAMKKVHEQFGADNDIATLYAESLMDLRPWDLWTGEGKPQPETPEIVALLEAVLIRDPSHPGANHYYVHAIEASPHPEKGTAAADRLRTLVPASGHMVHMPAHIYARTGRWEDAAVANRHAIETDREYRKLSPRQGFYAVYMAHNHQFLAWGCMMQGRKAEALASARAMVAGIPPEFVKDAAPFVDGYMTLPLAVLMRFGEWEQVLKEPRPADFLPVSNAMWRYTRAVALSNLGRREDAEKEREEFRAAVKKVPDGWHVGNSEASTTLAIAGHVLDGEMAYRAGSIDEAIGHLREAVKLEDTVNYDEPPDWLQPARHTLGAFLIEAGRTAEAEQVYREDLKKWPENGWALYGLSRCLEAEKSQEAKDVRGRFERAWASADTKIHATCLCVPKKP